MRPSSEKPVDRRAFFRTLLRGAALGALAGTTSFLFSKRRDGSQFQCANDRNCRDCSYCCNCPISNYSSPGCGPDCDSNGPQAT